MPRHALPSTTLSALVRARLGLTREELGDWLGVGVSQVGHVEAGRRIYSALAQARLRRLAALLPNLSQPEAPAAEGLPAAAGPTPAEAAALRQRLRACLHEVGQLRARQAAESDRKAALARRRQALAHLRLAVAASPPDPTEPALSTAREQQWLELLDLGTTRLARPLPTPTAQALLALRLRQLAEEAALLQALLANGSNSSEDPEE